MIYSILRLGILFMGKSLFLISRFHFCCFYVVVIDVADFVVVAVDDVVCINV